MSLFGRLIQRKPKQTTWNASVYWIHNRIVFVPFNEWENGGSFMGLPAVHTLQTDPLETIGARARETLAQSIIISTIPKSKEMEKPFFEAAQIRTWMELQRKAKNCSLVRDASGIAIIPSLNGGTRGDEKGYKPLEEKKTQLPLGSTDQQLGEALLRAFQLTE